MTNLGVRFSNEGLPDDPGMGLLLPGEKLLAADQPATQSLSKSRPTFRESLTQLINQYSKENSNNTPDYLLANFLIGCMDTFDLTVRRRDEWFGRENKISTTGKL
jgi:hypothetical protein